MFKLGSKKWAEIIPVKIRRKRFPLGGKNLLEEPDEGWEVWNTESEGEHGKENTVEVGRR